MSFKFYADFESVLKRVQETSRDSNSSYTEKYQKHIPCNFTYKIVYIDDTFSKVVVLSRGKNAVNRFIAAVLNECGHCRRVIKITLTKVLS